MSDKKTDKDASFEQEANMRELTNEKYPRWLPPLLAVIVVIGIFWGVHSGRKLTTCPWEKDALFALRALSNVELAYRDFNVEHNYGTLDALKQTKFINPKFPESKIVPHYRIDIKPSHTKNGTEYFAIRIYPLAPRRPCRTFMIGPDRKFMEFIPRVNSDPHNRDNWLDASYLEKEIPSRDRLPWMGENYPYT